MSKLYIFAEIFAVVKQTTTFLDWIKDLFSYAYHGNRG